MNQQKIICFGEVLWDLLPTGKMAGGAPMNVAFHLNNFGISASMISRVGQDELGESLLQFLETKGVDTSLIQTDLFYPTGTVGIGLDEKGTPSYEIPQPVAWDFINIDITNTTAIKAATAIVFGSLAARNKRSKETLFSLIDVANLKVFDVNLRTPFYRKEIVESLLIKADIVKMNDEELPLIGSWYFDELDELYLARKIRRHFDIDILIITQGSKGAFVLDINNQVYKTNAKKIIVQDTIGSGDSFLAGFLYQFLKDEPILNCLDFAARTGALVATKKGGTPKINEVMVMSLKEKL